MPVWKYCTEVSQRKNETAKGTYIKIGTYMKSANFIEIQIKEEKTFPEVISFKWKKNKERNNRSNT